MVAHAGDCAKMGEEMKKLVAANKPVIYEINAWEKANPAGKKAFDERHRGDMEAWMKKVEKPMTMCVSDPSVIEAMKGLE